MAGPTMIAPVHVAEYSAIIFGSAPSGATIGGIARIAGAWKARAIPNAKAITNSGATDVGLVMAYAISATDVNTSPPTANRAIALRLKRSATEPVTSTSSAIGRNSARPIHPMSDVRPLMS